MALIFVGFKDEEYRRAVRVFGLPDIISRYADPRLGQDVAPGDTVVYANGEEAQAERRARRPSFNDSEHF